MKGKLSFCAVILNAISMGFALGNKQYIDSAIPAMFLIISTIYLLRQNETTNK
jgi:hypothetical protein